ncbi:MerR family transcriptional regulator [Jannaschia sp. R86511]|uniref:MerR family transcriptional regulator n=1 Tax=Jannaschia sp. R86511 TaxID=3093853 RepID=UPI0036D3283D
MAWSTREVAELAGTTVKAVRHYHEVGLLEQPERASNGYKQYGVPHLLRVLQIKRLVELGVPLAQVATMGRADEDPDEALRLLDADLAASIERLQRVRAELAVILRHRAPVDLPPVFSDVGVGLTETDRSMLTIYARVLDDTWQEQMRQVLADQPRTPVDAEFDELPADADEATRQRIAEGLAPAVRRQVEEHANLSDFAAHAARSPAEAESTVLAALRELYNPAQLDVMHRTNLILQQQDEQRTTDEGTRP